MTPEQAIQPIDQLNLTSLPYLLKPGHCYFRPKFINSEQLDMRKPALFVGNHTLFGVMDFPFMLQHLYLRHGVRVRSLGDKVHFHVPLWRAMCHAYGITLGDRAICRELMQRGESIVVFPGGAREVMRRHGERYQLTWKKRLGFAHMAIEQGYDIIPFASIGPDDCFEIGLDAEQIQRLPVIGNLLKLPRIHRLLRKGDLIAPWPKGLAGLPIPRPEQFYFSFGERIITQGRSLDEADLWAVREEAASAIEQQVASLLKLRQQERQQTWSPLRRFLTLDRPDEAPVVRRPDQSRPAPSSHASRTSGL